MQYLQIFIWQSNPTHISRSFYELIPHPPKKIYTVTTTSTTSINVSSTAQVTHIRVMALAYIMVLTHASSYGVSLCYGVSPCYDVSPCYGVVPCYVTFAWVTRPERPEGAKDEVKRPEGPPARSRVPEGGGAPRLLVLHNLHSF